MRDKALAEIEKLPQRKFISEKDMFRWLDEVERIDPSRMMWHVRRLGGLGGTDIGEIVTHARGGWGFRSLDTVVAEKLMAIPPSQPNEKMKRGLDMEDTVRQMFHRQIGGVPRNDLVQRCMQDIPGEFSWIRSNPDDVVEIPGTGIYLADYKCPDEPHSSIATGYQVQLQVYDYKLFSAIHGRFPEPEEIPELLDGRPALSCDALILVSLDYKKWAASPLQAEYDIDLMRDSLVYGQKVWQAICSGKNPKIDRAKPERYELSTKDKSDLAMLDAKWTSLQVITKRADDLAKQAKAEIAEILRQSQSGEEYLGTFSKTTRKMTVDGDTLSVLMAENPHLDWDAVNVKTKKYDSDKLADWVAKNLPDADLSECLESKPSAENLVAFCHQHGITAPVNQDFTSAVYTGKKGRPVEEIKEFVANGVKQLSDMAQNKLFGRPDDYGYDTSVTHDEPPAANIEQTAQPSADVATNRELTEDELLGFRPR